MDALGVSELDICPWALREGVILRRFDMLDGAQLAERVLAEAQLAEHPHEDADDQGRPFGAGRG